MQENSKNSNNPFHEKLQQLHDQLREAGAVERPEDEGEALSIEEAAAPPVPADAFYGSSEEDCDGGHHGCCGGRNCDERGPIPYDTTPMEELGDPVGEPQETVDEQMARVAREVEQHLADTLGIKVASVNARVVERPTPENEEIADLFESIAVALAGILNYRHGINPTRKD